MSGTVADRCSPGVNLDVSFGTGGFVQTDMSSGVDEAQGTVVQKHRRIVLAGSAISSRRVGVLAHRLPVRPRVSPSERTTREAVGRCAHSTSYIAVAAHRTIGYLVGMSSGTGSRADPASLLVLFAGRVRSNDR